MRMRAIFVVFCFAASLFIPIGPAAVEIIRDRKAWDYAPLQYSDVVVRGVVASARDSTVASAEFWMTPPGRKLPITDTRVVVVTLRIIETLRGAPVPSTWSFLSWQEGMAGASGAYPVGAEMLICASLHPRLGVFYHAGVYGRYLWEGDGWRSGPTPRGDRDFADAALREKIAEMSIDSVASEAELVFVGLVRSISPSTVTGPNGASADQLEVLFHVEDIKRGRLETPDVTIVLLTAGVYLPAWRKHVPDAFEIGQRWLCFARKGEVGWYPFAGSNGLLRVESDHLVYDNRIQFWHSKESVEQTVRLMEGEDR